MTRFDRSALFEYLIVVCNILKTLVKNTCSRPKVTILSYSNAIKINYLTLWSIWLLKYVIYVTKYSLWRFVFV